MFLYKKELHRNKFRFPFDGIDRIETSYSQLLQDMFVLTATNGKEYGTFVEVGGDQAIFINNSYLLESQFGWEGITFDINPASYQSYQFHNRKSKFFLGDALGMDFEKILLDNFDSRRIDMLQLDLEPSRNTFACLKKIPLDIFRFSIILYETDFYDPSMSREEAEYIRSESTKILEDRGYVLVASNLSNLTDTEPMENWFMDGTYFAKNWINKFKRDSVEPIAAHKYLGLE